MDITRVIVYVDGSNFYHSLVGANHKQAEIVKIAANLLIPNQTIVEIKFFSAAVPREGDPTLAINQQEFFQKLKDQGIKIILGSIVKRPSSNVETRCPKHGPYSATETLCPKCGKWTPLSQGYRFTEKGVDVGLAVELVKDAFEDKFDTAFLFSGDADFVPAIKLVKGKPFDKRVIYCHIANKGTLELMQNCTASKVITEEVFRKSTP